MNKIQDELKLVFPTPEYKTQVEEYLQEFFDNGEYEIAGDGGLDRIKNFEEWLLKVQKDLSEESIEDNRIPATLYLTVRKSDNRVVGNLQIRHKLNEKLLQYGGHIGDSVRPSERRKGYATEQIRLALKKCKELGIDNVLMDCDKTNIGSAKSIINNGGILENEVYIGNELVQRYWISLNKRYANRHVTGKSQNTLYKINSVASNEFTGDICYYHFKEIINKITIPNGKCILDNGYKWIEFYDYNSKIKLTAIYDENSQIVEWYFDIARKIGKENDVPYEDDLYLDVVVTPTGEIILLDEDELQGAYNRLEVNKEEYDMAYNEANQLMKKLENNKNKLKEGIFQFLNASVPAWVVGGGLKLCEASKNFNNIPGKIMAMAGGLLIGMYGAASLSNLICDPYDKVPDRKLTLLDCIANVDDALGVLVLAKFPCADKLHLERTLPFVYSYCGYRAGKSN